MITPRYDVIINQVYSFQNDAQAHSHHAGAATVQAMQLATLVDVSFSQRRKALMLNIGGDGYGDFYVYINNELILLEKITYFEQAKTLLFNDIFASSIKVDVKNSSWLMNENSYYASIVTR